MLCNALHTKPKLCINCKYFIDNNLAGPEYGKCSYYPLNNTRFLVDGKNDMFGYRYASVTRGSNNLCGHEGKHYKKKYVKKVILPKVDNNNDTSTI